MASLLQTHLWPGRGGNEGLEGEGRIGSPFGPDRKEDSERDDGLRLSKLTGTVNAQC